MPDQLLGAPSVARWLYALAGATKTDSEVLASKTTIAGPAERSASLSLALAALVRDVASRNEWPPAVLDVDATASSLRARFRGRGVNLANLDPSEQLCLSAFTPGEWKAFWQAAQRAAEAKDRSIGHVECEARLLPFIVEDLHELGSLDSVFAWAPHEGGAMDLGALRCRVDILGTPDHALQVIASADADVEAAEHANTAILESVLFRRREDGTREPPVPLPLTRPHQPAVPNLRNMPCVGDTALQATLVESLRATIQCQPRESPLSNAQALAEANSAARALKLCGRFDDDESFGFDLTALAPAHADLVAKLPALAWDALRGSAERSGESIYWVTPHQRMNVHELGSGLQGVSPPPAITGRPCSGDEELVSALQSHLFVLTRTNPNFEKLDISPSDLEAVARSAALCGRFDQEGSFGFDFKGLTPFQAGLVNAFPPVAWKQFQLCAQRLEKDIAWIELHDAFVLGVPLLGALKQLGPPSRMSVAQPAVGIFLNLGRLQGEGTSPLKVVELRPRPGQPITAFAVTVPLGVRVRIAEGAAIDSQAVERSEIFYVGPNGKPVSRQRFGDVQQRALAALT